MNRRLRFISPFTVFLTILLSILVNVLTGENSVKELIAGIGTLGLAAVVVVITALLLVATYLQHRYEHESVRAAEDKIHRNEFEESVRRFFNFLRERYQNRYEQKLDGRFEITLEVSDGF